jgi:hypothetical protein
MPDEQTTARELIEMLQRVPQNMPVAVCNDTGKWSPVASVLSGRLFIKIYGRTENDRSKR